MANSTVHCPTCWQWSVGLPPVLSEVLILLVVGLFVAEGEEHRRQRKIISPAFSPQSLRALQPIFFSKGEELRDTMMRTITTENKDGGVVFDINNWVPKGMGIMMRLIAQVYPTTEVRLERYRFFRHCHKTVVSDASERHTN